VTTRSIAITPDSDIEDQHGLNLKEAALLALGVGGLTAAVVSKLELTFSILAHRGLRLLPSGQFSLILIALVTALVVLATVSAVLRPSGIFQRVFPLMGAFLMASGIVISLVA